jgi:CHAD domain-containing protein
MADGKWITDLGPDLTIAQAARIALRERLESVRDTLAPVLQQNDPDSVHRLRVATRRADAALHIFCETLPYKTYKKARKRLRGLRKSAGVARDSDVFFFNVLAHRVDRPAVDLTGVEFVAGYALGMRTAAQPELEKSVRENRSEFDEFIKDIVAGVSAAARDPQLVYLSRTLISSLLHELEDAASGNLTDYRHLHQVRIAGKRLRYAMEVFAYCFAEPFRESVYPQIEQMQETLGNANDCHVAVNHLLVLRARVQASSRVEWNRVRAGFNELLRQYKSRLIQERRRFTVWWKNWNKGGKQRLLELLRPAADALAGH